MHTVSSIQATAEAERNGEEDYEESSPSMNKPYKPKYY